MGIIGFFLNKRKKTRSGPPRIALVSTPMQFKGYYANNDEMAVDDLGLGYLYTAVKNKGFDARVIDSNHTHRTENELIDEILKYRPSYIGFSDPIITFKQSLALCKKIKEKLPGVVTIYGDIHASLYNKEILENEPQVDYIIVGDGDISFPMLIHALENGEDISSISGLTYRDNGEIKETPPKFDLDLNTLPYPYRSSLMDSRPNTELTYNIVISRGCPGRCSFCSIATFANTHCKPAEGIPRSRSRNAKSVFEEIQYLYDQGVNKFWICDDNWIGDRETNLQDALELSELIIKNGLGISFSALIRPDSLIPSDRDNILQLKEAGLNMLTIGLEASNKEQLRIFAKRYDLEVAKEVVKVVHDCEVAVSIPYIMFFPYSTLDMLRQNISYLQDADLAQHYDSYCVNLAGFSRMNIEKKLNRDGLVITPTTYSTVGKYRFQDQKIKNLYGLIAAIFIPEFEKIFVIRSTGMEASHRSKHDHDAFKHYIDSVKKVGSASANLFKHCIDLCEEGMIQEDRIKILAEEISGDWKKVLNNETTHLTQTFQSKEANYMCLN